MTSSSETAPAEGQPGGVVAQQACQLLRDRRGRGKTYVDVDIVDIYASHLRHGLVDKVLALLFIAATLDSLLLAGHGLR